MPELSEHAKHLALDEELQQPDPPEVITEEEAQRREAEAQRPDFLVPRYQTVEEQARAYKEAEREMHETKQQAKQLEERLAALEAQQQQFQQPQQPQPWEMGYGPQSEYFSQAEYEAQLQQLAREDPLTAMRAVMAEAEEQRLAHMQQQAQVAQMQQQQLQPWQEAQQQTQAQLIADHAYNRVLDQNPDYEEYHEDVVKLMEQDPGWINPADAWDLNKLTTAVTRAYKVVKGERLSATDDELRARGLTQADIERQRKLSAQTVQGRSAAPESELTEEQKNLAGMLASGTDGSYKQARQHLWGALRAPQ